MNAAVIPRHGTIVAQAKEDFHGITGHEGSWRVLRQEGSPVLRLHRDGPAVVIHQRVAEVLDDTRPLLDVPHRGINRVRPPPIEDQATNLPVGV